MKIKSLYEEKIPDYALSYLINGDNSGITSEDIKVIDDYMEEFYNEAESCNGNVVIELTEDQEESYFTWSPAFGLACNVYDCNIAILY
jgi:hypothetical protein